jgi:arylsulfatase A-like enzyme
MNKLSNPDKPVNFLFLITDQQRADYLGCYGHPLLRTPHIDAIAAQGTRFERFFVASPVCMPNRAALLTGRYPSVNGVRYNGNYLPYSASTFVEVLRAGGYRTALIGKSHVQPMTGEPPYARVDPATLGPIEEAWKDDAGDYTQEEPEHYEKPGRFEIQKPYYGFEHVDMVTKHSDQCSGHYLQWLREQTPQWQALRDRSNQLPHHYSCPQAIRTALPEELYNTSYIRDRAIDYLSRRADDDAPFFAFVSFPDPHHPFTPPGRYWDRYDPEDFAVERPFEAHKNPPPPLLWSRRKLLDGTRHTAAQDSFMAYEHELKQAMALTCGMISMIDDAVGTLIETLKASGQYDNTVIIFSSDHGDYLGDYGLLLKGALPFQAITRIPFIWSDPRRRSAQVNHALCSMLDIAPSIIERAGLRPYWGLQGKSFLAGEAIRDELMIEYQDGMCRMGFTQPAFVRSLITDHYRLTFYKGEPWGELYDLGNDPDESHNRWDDADYAAVRGGLSERLLRQMMNAVDQSPRSQRKA